MGMWLNMTTTRVCCTKTWWKFIKWTGFRFLKSWTLQPSLLLRQFNILPDNLHLEEANNKSNVKLNWKHLHMWTVSGDHMYIWKVATHYCLQRAARNSNRHSKSTEFQKEINCATLMLGQLRCYYEKTHTQKPVTHQTFKGLPLDSQTWDCFHNVSKIMPST